jgi:ABC-type Fe3+ transport system substrate-binding protein
MNPSIHPDMRLDRLLEQFPNTRAVFEAHGLGRLVTEVSLGAVGPFLTLQTALMSHGVATDLFVQLLNDFCQKESPLDAPSLAEARRQGPVNLLTLLPCGLKVPFAKALATFIKKSDQRGGQSVNYSVESNLNQELSYYPYVNHIDSLDELPDLIVSADFNPFFHHRFYRRFIQPGHFVDTMQKTPNALYTGAGISDPRRQYTILGINPLIIVADLKSAGDRPLPGCWADLLDPMWRNSITLRGNDHFFCHAVLLPFFKEHGLAGMRALAANVADGRHPSQMVKTAGIGRSSALYVMPDFFARQIPARRSVRVIWPADGALASPITLMVKRKKAERLKPITDYLTGKDLARILAGAYFPSPHPTASNRLPVGTGVKWLGWDYIRTNDLETANAEIDRVFLPAVHQRRCS